MTTTVEKQFAAMGARVKVENETGWDPRPGIFNRSRPFTINVAKDQEGEYFNLRVAKEVELLVQDVQRSDKHLLLLAKTPGERQGTTEKARFLCGHDERHWFSATIPTAVTTVLAAKQALKPAALVQLEQQAGIRGKDLHKRHKKLKSGAKIHRQGEFFFTPEAGFHPDSKLILKNEPMRGGGHNFHHAQFMYRSGGEQVWVRGDTVLSNAEFDKLGRRGRANVRGFERRMADAAVWVKGKITHIEHATCDLGDIWHRVHVNTENRVANRFGRFSMSNRFID